MVDVVNYPVEVGHNISAIRGLMPRKFVDYNRSWPSAINYYPLTQPDAQTALNDARLSGAYNIYHESVRSLLAEGVDNFGNDGCLLIDMHGFSHQPVYAPKPDGYDLILGTGNRQTIYYGEVDLAIGSFFQSRGYSVFIPQEETLGGQIEDVYSADFTTRHHSETMNINAIQVEIASRFRDSQSGKILGPKLSADLAQFLNYFYGNNI